MLYKEIELTDISKGIFAKYWRITSISMDRTTNTFIGVVCGWINNSDITLKRIVNEEEEYFTTDFYEGNPITRYSFQVEYDVENIITNNLNQYNIAYEFLKTSNGSLLKGATDYLV